MSDRRSEMNSFQPDELGDILFDAYVRQSPIDPLTVKYPEMGIDDSYQVAQRFVARLLEKGHKPIGKKIGVTSKAVQEMLGFNRPDFGVLTDHMAFASGDTVPISETMIQPRAEGEIAFVLKSRLMGPGITNADVLAATDHVFACFEIIDSRIRDWKIQIQDTVADNASCGAFVLGDQPISIANLDLTACGAVVSKNEVIAATGVGAAALGSPVSCVAWLANELGARGVPLNAGEIILSGSIVPLIDVVPGDKMTLTISGLGSVSVDFS